MRLWRSISKVSSQLPWRRLGRGKRTIASDPETALIRDLTTKGAPMSLASVKAALDATSSTREVKRAAPMIDPMESLRFPTIGDPGATFLCR